MDVNMSVLNDYIWQQNLTKNMKIYLIKHLQVWGLLPSSGEKEAKQYLFGLKLVFLLYLLYFNL